MEIIKRIAAFLMILVILGLVVWAFILGITGSEYFSAALFLCILVPVLFYGISLVTRLLTAKEKNLRIRPGQTSKQKRIMLKIRYNLIYSIKF